MVSKKPKVVIIGAGMAGITAANKLYTTAKELFDLCVVEGGTRIGGRIKTSEFGGSRIEMGATWIHGIGGSPVYNIAQEINSLESQESWECMDEFLDEPLTIAEGGYVLDSSLVDPISNLFKKLMDFSQRKDFGDGLCSDFVKSCKLDEFLDGLCSEIVKSCSLDGEFVTSVGSFLRKGLNAYWGSRKDEEGVQGFGNWSKESLEEGIFAMLENTQRTYTSASDLQTLDFDAEREYCMFPGKEITIAKGYSTIVESLASVLPDGLIQLGRKVAKIEWQLDEAADKAVKLHFNDGSIMYADHVIVTVSLGVLKQAIHHDSGMFSPPLPSFKIEAISRLGFGVVNKLFLQLNPKNDENGFDGMKFPCLQMVFHQSDSKLRCAKIPWWMRRTACLCPIHGKSNVLLSWFVGEEALELESLGDKEIIDGFSSTISSFQVNSKNFNNSNPHESCNGHACSQESVGKEILELESLGDEEIVDENPSTIPNFLVNSKNFKNSKPHANPQESVFNTHESCNGHANYQESFYKFDKVLKSQWGNDPLFLGSYSYVAVGSSGDDLDTMAEPLPKRNNHSVNSKPLQILFAGEATHRTHYSTTHGAYFSGLREANRLLKHYNCIDI